MLIGSLKSISDCAVISAEVAPVSVVCEIYTGVVDSAHTTNRENSTLVTDTSPSPGQVLKYVVSLKQDRDGVITHSSWSRANLR